MPDHINALSDWELLERCRTGDERAWDELVDRHKESLRLSVRSVLRGAAQDTHLVEDVCQDVLLALIDERYRRLGLYNPRQGCFDTFLRVLAKEVIRRSRRSKGGRNEHDVPLNGHEPADAAGNDGLAQAELNEYLEDLTAQEIRCLGEKVLRLPGESAAPPISAGNERFLRHRLHEKWKEHFDTP